MANTPQAEKPKYPHGLTREQMLDVSLIPQEKYKTITIPEEDPLGKPHEDIVINGQRFVGGETYKIDPLTHDDLVQRLDAYKKQIQQMFQQNKTLRKKQLAVTSMGAGYEHDALAAAMEGK